jgi:hypothetical protein
MTSCRVRVWSGVLGILSLGFVVGVLPACQPDQPGVKSTHRSQWANVHAGTVDATDAARATFEELGLRNIEGAATEVDGQVVGYLADNTRVIVSIARVTENASEVTVNVGRLGDPDLGKDILARIQARTGQ